MLDAKLDHVAIAVRDLRSAIPLYCDALGARFLFAGERAEQGFRWAQFGLPAGGQIELVTPLDPDGFVGRFLARNGEGVHHLTLKVPDLVVALADLDRRGVPYFGAALDRPDWKEAFIHPRDAHGALIQVAQSAFDDEDVARHHLAPHPDGSHRHLLLEDLLADVPDNAAESGTGPRAT